MCRRCGCAVHGDGHYGGFMQRPQFCSDACRQAAYRARHRVEIQPIDCAWCSESFIPIRSTAQYCSGACRAAAHRTRRAREGS
jgi:hypothetical protein